MNREKLPQAKNYVKKHKRLSIWHKVLMSMAAVVVFVTTYMLILPAITLESGAMCGMAEHTHTDACYVAEKVLVCGKSEDEISPVEDEATSGESAEIKNTEPHKHTDACYKEENKLVCTLTEHKHTEECYKKQNSDSGEDNSDIKTDDSSSDVPPKDFELNKDTCGDLSEHMVSVDAENNKNIIGDSIKAAVLYSNLVGDKLAKVEAATIVAGTGTKAIYNPKTDTFDTKLELRFEPSVSDVESHNYQFLYKLPPEIVELVDIELETSKWNDDSTEHKFQYKFLKDNDGTYYIAVDFDKTYVDGLGVGEQLTDGYIKFETHIKGSAVNEQDKIELKFDGEVTLTVPTEEIQYPENSTARYDVTSGKTSSYSSNSNAVTYTVTAYSTKGTPNPLVINDAITDLNGINIKDYKVEVKKATKSDYVANDGSYTNEGEIKPTDEVVSVTPSVDITNGTMQLNLPALEKANTHPDPNDPNGDRGYYKDCNAYVITYTYFFDDSVEIGNVKNIENSVKVSATPENGKPVNSTSKVTTKIERKEVKAVEKGAVRSGDVITWTIELDKTIKDFSGGTLSDDMLSIVNEGNINISPNTGYTFTHSSDGDSNSAITGIKFDENCSEKYTITYQTKITEWNKKDYINTAVLKDSKGETIGSSTGKIEGAYAGNISKSDGKLKAKDDANGTQTIEWSVTVDVPEGGMPKGLVITDNLGNTQAGHYMTSADAESVFNALNGSPFKGKYNGITFKDSSGKSYPVASASDLPDNTTFVSFSYELSEDYAWKDGAHNFTYSYTTTIKPDDSEKITYLNNISVPDRWNPDKYYEYEKKVIKTDGNGKSGTTATKDDKGNVVWKIKVNTDSPINTMKVTDNLPDKVELTKLEVALGNDYNYETVEVGTPKTVKDFTFNASVSDNSVIADVTASNKTPENNVIYLKYTCKLKEQYMPESSEEVFELTNTADVAIDGEPYDSASQTQNLTVNTGSDEKKPVDKAQKWNSKEQVVTCAVELNPSSAKYGIDGFYDFTDTFSYYDGTGHDNPTKSYRKFSLDYNSLKLYKAEVYEETDESGKLVKKMRKIEPALDSGSWSYTYKTETKKINESWGRYNDVKNIINAKFPDETPLIFEYAYVLESFVKVPGDTTVGALNTAKINSTISGLESDSKTEEEWQSSGSSGGIGSKKIYTVYKVAEDNYNNHLQGAVFALYQYTGSDSYTKVQTFTTDENGMIEVKQAITV